MSDNNNLVSILNSQKKVLDQHSEKLAQYRNEYQKLLQSMQQPSTSLLPKNEFNEIKK